MNIRFVHTCELEVAVDYVMATDEAITEPHTFTPKEIYEIDIFDDHGFCVDLQFGDGSRIYGLNKTAYEEVL